MVVLHQSDDEFNVPTHLESDNEAEVDEQVEAEPEAEEEAAGPAKKKQKVTRVTTAHGDFELDVGTMLATRVHAIDQHIVSDESKRLEYLREIATQGTQAIVEQMFRLPTEPCDVGILAVMPAPITVLPREKPIPTPKPPTRWEQFASRKGIQKKGKRDRLVFDDATEEWKPRYGSQRANKGDSWIMEHKEGADPSEDPWTKLKQEKKERVAKNQKSQVRNLLAASGQKLPGAIDLASAIKAAKPAPKQHKMEKNKKGEDGMAKAQHAKAALHLAQQSTASMGKFDKLNKDEPQPKQSRIAKKASLVKKHSKKKPNSAPDKKATIDTEKNASLQLLSRVLEPPKVNVQKAVVSNKRKSDETNRKVNEMARAGGKRKRQ
jgi:regulator of ribosome biosynthesis